MVNQEDFSRLKQDAESGKYCEQCRAKRKNFTTENGKKCLVKENKHSIGLCPVCLGCWSDGTKELPNTIDVMIVTESHGGGTIWKQIGTPMDDIIHHKYEHYVIIPHEKFHSYLVNKILKELTKRGIKWYLTDLVKCYVDKDNANNFKVACEQCKHYLKREKDIIEPKMTIFMAKSVFKNDDQLKELFKPNILFYNPSRMTADWCIEELLKWAKKKYNEEVEDGGDVVEYGIKAIVDEIVTEIKP